MRLGLRTGKLQVAVQQRSHFLRYRVIDLVPLNQ